jgi:hypothetical protein
MRQGLLHGGDYTITVESCLVQQLFAGGVIQESVG